jgi:hypothetical protein
MLEEGDFVPIENCWVSRATSLGLFVIVEGKRVFVPVTFIHYKDLSYTPGDVVTLQVLRSYAEQERLIA